MRILFLSERFPWPLEDGGNIRTYHLLRTLASKHDVTLIAHDRRGIGNHPLADLCRVKIVGRPYKAVALLRRHTRRCGWVTSFFINRNWSHGLYQAAVAELKAFQPDLVYCNHLDTACYLPDLGWPEAVFDTHNCLSNMAIERGCDRSAWSRLMRIEAARLARLEAEICRRARLVFTCSEPDATAFAKLSECKNLTVVPNGVDCDYYHDNSSATPRCSKKLLFVGAMNYLPNIEAAEWFCSQVLPKLSDRHSDLKIEFVGADPPPRVRKLTAHPGVAVTGRVEDVRPYLRQCAAVVVPLLHGGGTRLKILEAMAAGCPIVSTSKGAEGIQCTAGNDLLIADSAQDMADCISQVLEEPHLREKISTNALRTAAAYDWKKVGQRLVQAIDDLRLPNKPRT